MIYILWSNCIDDIIVHPLDALNQFVRVSGWRVNHFVYFVTVTVCIGGGDMNQRLQTSKIQINPKKERITYGLVYSNSPQDFSSVCRGQ